jgi:uncharacterized damage-inducible protein DinB
VFGNPWHGPSVGRLVADVTPSQATSRPIQEAHSIIELVLHLIAWTREVTSRLQGNSPALPALGDWPPAGSDPGAVWLAIPDALLSAHQTLLDLVSRLSASRLSAPVGAAYSAQLGTGVPVAIMLLGVAQHAAYHGGQIALLRRAFGDLRRNAAI